MIKCKHSIGNIKKNDINEDILFCELTDTYCNITLGECLENCDAEEEGDNSEIQKETSNN